MRRGKEEARRNRRQHQGRNRGSGPRKRRFAPSGFLVKIHSVKKLFHITGGANLTKGLDARTTHVYKAAEAEKVGEEVDKHWNVKRTLGQG